MCSLHQRKLYAAHATAVLVSLKHLSSKSRISLISNSQEFEFISHSPVRHPHLILYISIRRQQPAFDRFKHAYYLRLRIKVVEPLDVLQVETKSRFLQCDCSGSPTQIARLEIMRRCIEVLNCLMHRLTCIYRHDSLRVQGENMPRVPTYKNLAIAEKSNKRNSLTCPMTRSLNFNLRS